MSELIKNEYIKLYREFGLSVNSGSLALSDDKNRGYTFKNIATVRDSDIYYSGNNYTSVSSNTPTYSSLSEYTFKVSFNYLPSSASQRILCLGSTKILLQGIIVTFQANTVAVYFFKDKVANYIGSIPATANTWHNLIVDIKGNRLILSLNDYEDSVEFVSNSIVSNSAVGSLHIATEGGGENFAKGYISNVEFYNVSLYDIKLNKSLILHDGEHKRLIREESIVNVPSTTNAIPNMTSNTSPSGKVYYSSKYSNDYEGWKAFNSTDYPESYATASGAVSGFLAYEFPSAIAIGKYRIRSMGHSVYIKSMIKSWTFEGSNNTTNGADGDWDILDSQINQSWDVFFSRDYLINNENNYRTYRINFTENNDTLQSLLYSGIGQLMMYALVEDVIYGNLIWENVSLNNITTDGMDSLSPLLDRRIETLKLTHMTDKSEILNDSEAGKVFSQTINLKKYLDIRSINVEVE